MADAAMLGSDNAVVFMVSAGLVYEIIAAACSSPQTTEINASARSETLMKWVRIGLLQAALFVAIAIMIAGSHARRLAAAAGGALAGVIMYASYTHAETAGLASGGAATESY